jgi:hypothetical protein
MPKTNRRKRHRILAPIAAGASLLIVAIVVLCCADPKPRRPPYHRGAADWGAAHDEEARPGQDASCPDVQMISIPYRESSPQLDPFNLSVSDRFAAQRH